MTDPLTLEDLAAGETGCIHNHARFEAVVAAVNTFFTNPPANTSQRVDVQLKAALDAAAGKSVSAARCEKAVRLWLDRR